MTAAWKFKRYVAKKALEIACPHCRMPAGSQCETASGRTREPHSRRMSESFAATVQISHGEDGGQ